ncbi:hypothetical protein D3C73_477890 [compost metagenome]
MNVLNLLKQLKKMLRSKRRWLTLGIFLVLVTAGLIQYAMEGRNGLVHSEAQVFSAQDPTDRSMETLQQQEALTNIMRMKEKRDAFVTKKYVCGEELQKLGALSADEIIAFHEQYPDWSLSFDMKGPVMFTAQIDDLSPSCKETGTFGVDASGNLSLFSGAPGQDNVVRTFFQLNIQHLESSLPKETVKQLHDGIRVTDLAEYNSVLSTFSDYAVLTK